jgi:transcriptional regulator with XRE-family HTH domain
MQHTTLSSFPQMLSNLHLMTNKDNKVAVVENVLNTCGMTRIAIAKKLGMTRQNLRIVLLDEEKLTAEFLLRLGKIIHYDFSSDFAELHAHSAFIVAEPEAVYGDTPLIRCMQEKEKWKATSYNLSQELNELQKKYTRILELALEQGIKIV